jgi:dTDP-glucose 4,6-dehydratase
VISPLFQGPLVENKETSMSLIPVTGGAGFTAAKFVHYALSAARIISLGALTDAGNLDTLQSGELNPNHRFSPGAIPGDIRG